MPLDEFAEGPTFVTGAVLVFVGLEFVTYGRFSDFKVARSAVVLAAFANEFDAFVITFAAFAGAFGAGPVVLDRLDPSELQNPQRRTTTMKIRIPPNSITYSASL